MTVEMRQWHITPELERDLSAHYKARQAVECRSAASEYCVQEFTFDGVAPHLTTTTVEAFIRYIDRWFLKGKLQGVGVEVGAGPGTFSALLARNEHVHTVHSVEACKPIAELAQAVVPYLAGKAAYKVISCVGDFNRLELQDGSVDFVFDFFSLHHSSDIRQTFRELARVLRPGGIVLCLDKARSDSLSDKNIEELLDREYPPEFKVKVGIAPDAKHTRRMNGEYEYRLREWREAFLENGFSDFEHFNVARTVSGNRSIALAKSMFSRVPPRWQARLTSLAHPFFTKDLLASDHRVYTSLVNDFPKEISLMVAYK